MAYPEEAALRDRLETVTDASRNRWVDAEAIVRALLGASASPNVFLLGVAVQAGAVPVSVASLERAIDLNGVAVDTNLAAFALGRAWAVDPGRVEAAAGGGVAGPSATATFTVPDLPRKLAARVDALPDPVREAVEVRAADLVGHTGPQLAERYLDVIERVAAAGPVELTEAAAHTLHHLMAYKDEYEVARLLMLPETQAVVDQVGGPGATYRFHLHPPMLKALGMDTKLKLSGKTRPMFAALAKGRRLRGTRLDPFGATEMRRLERVLPDEQIDVIDRVLARADELGAERAVEIVMLADRVRGYEDLKMRRIAEWRAAVRTALG